MLRRKQLLQNQSETQNHGFFLFILISWNSHVIKGMYLPRINLLSKREGGLFPVKSRNKSMGLEASIVT